jgi:hypothetical protein
MYYCHSREGGNPEKWENSTFYEIVNIEWENIKKQTDDLE